MAMPLDRVRWLMKVAGVVEGVRRGRIIRVVDMPHGKHALIRTTIGTVAIAAAQELVTDHAEV